MNTILQVVLLFSIFSLSQSEDPKITYYKNLISSYTHNKPPTNVSDTFEEFEKGAKLNTSENFGVFDFIIVGAGSTGNVIATRLSEVQDWKILVLEAGGEENDFTDIPYFAGSVRYGDDAWAYETVPQKNACFNSKERKCVIPRGRIVGGSSTVNGMHYVRGNRRDFDRWPKNWNYDNVLRYFKKSESSQVQGDKDYHGKGGYLNVQHTKPTLEAYSVLVNANKEIGRKEVDYNGKSQLGFSRTQVTIKNGKRQSSGRAFLENARFRDNLNVILGAFVTQIIINKTTKKAVGVYFTKDNRRFKVLVKKDVILSAGAFNSPQLLMLSGIGPRKHLEKLGIDTIQDLPVGRNLIEHPNLTLNIKTNLTGTRKTTEEHLKDFLKGTGAYTRPGTTGAIGFESFGRDDGAPMIEYLYSFHESLVNFLVLLQHPISRGSVSLKSANPIDKPLIDLNVLSDAEGRDVKNLVSGVKFVLDKLIKTQAFRGINASYVKPKICLEHPKDSDDFWKCFLKNEVWWFGHPCSTTRMGADKNDSVVDQDLRVHGIKGLRVADAGVIPSTMSGHLYAVVVMIGEKASDLIKQNYGEKISDQVKQDCGGKVAKQNVSDQVKQDCGRKVGKEKVSHQIKQDCGRKLRNLGDTKAGSKFVIVGVILLCMFVK